MPDLKFDMGRYEPGDSHIGDQDLNALADALIRQISGGDGIVVRKYGNRITISLDRDGIGRPPSAPLPPSTAPRLQVTNSDFRPQDFTSLPQNLDRVVRFNFDLTSGFMEENVTEIRYATNTDPIQVSTKSDHGLRSGDTVNVSGVSGNSATNGSHIVGLVYDDRDFELENTTGNGEYTSGGLISRAGQVNVRLIPTSYNTAGGVDLNDQRLGRGTKVADKMGVVADPTSPFTANTDLLLRAETQIPPNLRLGTRAGGGANFSLSSGSAVIWLAGGTSSSYSVSIQSLVLSSTDAIIFFTTPGGVNTPFYMARADGGSNAGTISLDSNATFTSRGYVWAGVGFVVGSPSAQGWTGTIPVGTQPVVQGGIITGHT